MKKLMNCTCGIPPAISKNNSGYRVYCAYKNCKDQPATLVDSHEKCVADFWNTKIKELRNKELKNKEKVKNSKLVKWLNK